MRFDALGISTSHQSVSANPSSLYFLFLSVCGSRTALHQLFVCFEANFLATHSYTHCFPLSLSLSLSLRCPSSLSIRTSCGTGGWMNGSLWLGCRSTLKDLILPMPLQPLWHWHDNTVKQWTEQQQVLLWYYAKVANQVGRPLDKMSTLLIRTQLWTAKVWESADIVMQLVWWTLTH